MDEKQEVSFMVNTMFIAFTITKKAGKRSMKQFFRVAILLGMMADTIVDPDIVIWL